MCLRCYGIPELLLVIDGFCLFADVWDATVLASKAIVDSWDACHTDGVLLDTICAFDGMWGRSHAYVGTTGFFYFNAAGDRSGVYSIFNVVNSTARKVGSSSYTGRRVNITFDLETYVWSNGESNRTTVPMWGQALPTTTTAAPTSLDSDLVFLAASDGDNGADDVRAATYGLGIILAIALVIFVVHQARIRHKKLRPADFRKIITMLEVEQQVRTNAKDRLPRELPRKDIQVKDGVQLGDGQFGRVCAGVWTLRVRGVQTNIPVAVKMLQLTNGLDSEVDPDLEARQQEFMREAGVTWQV